MISLVLSVSASSGLHVYFYQSKHSYYYINRPPPLLLYILSLYSDTKPKKSIKKQDRGNYVLNEDDEAIKRHSCRRSCSNGSYVNVGIIRGSTSNEFLRQKLSKCGENNFRSYSEAYP